MHVGTFSGVKSPGIVISSALGGTSKGNSSLTNDNIKDVFPTFLIGFTMNNKVDKHFEDLPITDKKDSDLLPTSESHLVTQNQSFFHFLFMKVAFSKFIYQKMTRFTRPRKSSQKSSSKQSKICKKSTFSDIFPHFFRNFRNASKIVKTFKNWDWCTTLNIGRFILPTTMDEITGCGKPFLCIILNHR